MRIHLMIAVEMVLRAHMRTLYFEVDFRWERVVQAVMMASLTMGKRQLSLIVYQMDQSDFLVTVRLLELWAYPDDDAHTGTSLVCREISLADKNYSNKGFIIFQHFINTIGVLTYLILLTT